MKFTLIILSNNIINNHEIESKWYAPYVTETWYVIYFQNEKENKKDGSDEINKEIIELEREEERMKIKLEKMDISKKGIVGGITSNTGQDSVFRNFNKNSAILEDNGKKFLEGFKKKQSLKQISSEDSLTKQKKKKEKEQRLENYFRIILFNYLFRKINMWTNILDKKRCLGKINCVILWIFFMSCIYLFRLGNYRPD